MYNVAYLMGVVRIIELEKVHLKIHDAACNIVYPLL